MANIVTLEAQKREEKGKGAAKKLRNDGKIPVVFYQNGEETVHLNVVLHEVELMLMNKTPLVELKWEDQSRECVIREIQRHPITHTPTHIDFLGIVRGQTIVTTVPVKVTGIAEGVKNFGGILQQPMREVDIEVLPKDIPDYIEVNVTDLNIGDSIHLRDIVIEGVKWEDNPARTVATVMAPKIAKGAGSDEEEGEEGAEEETEEGGEE